MSTTTIKSSPLSLLRLLKKLADSEREYTDYFQQVLDQYIGTVLTPDAIEASEIHSAIAYLRVRKHIGTLNVPYMIAQLQEIVTDQEIPA